MCFPLSPVSHSLSHCPCWWVPILKIPVKPWETWSMLYKLQWRPVETCETLRNLWGRLRTFQYVGGWCRLKLAVFICHISYLIVVTLDLNFNFPLESAVPGTCEISWCLPYQLPCCCDTWPKILICLWSQLYLGPVKENIYIWPGACPVCTWPKI